MLSFSDVEMIPIIYHRSLDKDAFWSPGALGEHPSLIQTVDRKQHAEKRTLFAPTMSMKVLLKLEDGIDSAVTKLLDTFKNDAKRGRSSNFSYHARCYVHESTLRLLFGSRPNVEHRRDTPRLLSAARSVAMPFCLTALFPYLMVPFMRVPFLKYLIVPRSQDKRGFGQMMAAHRHLRPSVTNADISAELLLLMAAAPDTTSPLASALLTSILTCPHTLHAVLAELAAAVSTNALHPSHPAPWAAISRLPYFMACVHEAARLYPSIPVLLPRCVGPAGMVLPDGRFVPASTAVAAAPAVINRDEGMFGKDAAVWRPERWLEEREQGGRMQRFLFTWGWGARKCAGKNVALLECCKLVVQVGSGLSFVAASEGLG
ncbi:hypothetical protein MMC11_001441 [Xylographa trunciseda]|nr:hypothetical protein [Xylographa trunciseda]